MKNLSLKISLIVFSYVTLLILIILSYVSIVPEDKLLVLENKSPLVKKIENQLSSKKESVYKILEKPKKIEDIIENELSNSKKSENSQEKLPKIYRLQFASFKDKNKSYETKKKILEGNFFKDNKIDLGIKKIDLDNNITYFRVISVNLFSYVDANSYCEILKKKKINCIIIKE
jgi:hypothetical protein